MTTPQSQLYWIADNLRELRDIFKPQEDELDIFEQVKQLYSWHGVLVKKMEKIEDQQALIIKLLSEKNKT